MAESDSQRAARFFVFGPERSGTTLLAFLLSGQPDTFVVNDSFVFDRFAEWALLRSPDPGAAPAAPLPRLARLAAALGPAGWARIATGDGSLRDRYYAARERHLSRFTAEQLLSADEHAAFQSFLRSRYRFSLSEGRKNFLNEYAELLPESPRAEGIGEAFATTLSAIAERYGAGSKPWLGEKTPLHTYYADWILRFHPRARAILLVREPIANIVSMQRHYGSLDQAIASYDLYASRILQLKDQERVLAVRHEDVAATTPEVIEGILRFLDPALRFDPGCPVNAYTKVGYTGTRVDAERSRAPADALTDSDRARIRQRFRDIYAAFYD